MKTIAFSQRVLRALGSGRAWTWTIDRKDKVIFQQCAFFNGEAITGTNRISNDASGGKSNVDGTDCRGSDGDQECKFKFALPYPLPDFQLVSETERERVFKVPITSGDYSWQGQKTRCEETNKR